MPEADESGLLAVCLPAPDAAEAVRAAWVQDEAVAVLDPHDPPHRVEERLRALRPTELLDARGRRPWSDGWGAGRPVPAGVAAVVATSGTTAAPRLVMLDASALATSALAVHAALEADPIDDHWLACLPLHHVAGIAILARAFHTGTPVTVLPRFDPQAVAAAPKELGATMVSLVPTTLARMLDAGLPLDGFRRILLGGAAVPPALLERARHAGAQIVTTYGQTETGGGCVHDGHPLRGVEIRTDERGELLVRGAVVMRGYLDDPEGTARAFTDDGCLRTGDLGRVLADGTIEITDRLRDIVVTGGVNVAPSAVEAVLRTHPTIADVCVAGLPDDDWGERVVAWVVPTRPDAAIRLADLRAFAGSRLAPAELPREVRVVEAIPRSPSGKPLRRVLRG